MDVDYRGTAEVFGRSVRIDTIYSFENAIPNPHLVSAAHASLTSLESNTSRQTPLTYHGRVPGACAVHRRQLIFRGLLLAPLTRGVVSMLSVSA